MTTATTEIPTAPVPAQKRSRAPFYSIALALIAILAIVCWHFGAFRTKPRLALVVGEGAYYDLVLAGAQEAARQYDVNVSVVRVKGDLQSAALRDLAGQGYDGVAVSPFNPVAEAAVLTDLGSKTTLVTFDSDSPASSRLCFVGTDNYAAGRWCGQQARLAAPDGGAVIILVATLDKENLQRRRQGVIDELLDRPYDPAHPMDPVDQPLSGSDKGGSGKGGSKYSVALTLIDAPTAGDALIAQAADALKQHDIKCLIGLNTSSTAKLLAALDQAQKSGKVPVIGFDADPQTLAGIESGAVFATILQDQFGCGFHAVRILAETARGNRSGLPMFQRRTLPVEIVTKENVAEVRSSLGSGGPTAPTTNRT